jgi:hypothetical protein
VGDQRGDHRARDEDRSAGQRGRHAVGEEVGAVGAGAGTGEDRDEDAEAERSAGVMGHIDQATGDAGVLTGNAGHSTGRERGPAEALADAEYECADPERRTEPAGCVEAS